MSESTTPVPPMPPVPKSRGWLIFFAVASLLVGVFAIVRPGLAALAIEQVIGIFCVVSGVFSIGNVIFNRDASHRTASIILAIIRLAVGLVLLAFPLSGVLSLALVLGIFFIAEGFVFLAGAFGGVAGAPKWLMVLNGVVALVLGAMVLFSFPSDAPQIIGLLYGINSIFYGVTLLSLVGRHPASIH